MQTKEIINSISS